MKSNKSKKRAKREVKARKMTFSAKLKNPKVITCIIVALLLVAAAVYATLAYVIPHTTKLKMVSYDTIKNSIVTSNEANKKNFETYTKAIQSVNEKQVVLTRSDKAKNPSQLKDITAKEIERRLSEIKANKKYLESTTADAKDVKKKLNPYIDTTLENLEALLATLKEAGTDAEKVKAVASVTDAQFVQYTTVNQAAKLLAAQQNQVIYTNKLKETTRTLQKTLEAAKSNGATHINMGPAGFVAITSFETNIKKIREGINSNLIVSKSILQRLNDALDNSDTTIAATSGDTKLATSESGVEVSTAIAYPDNVSIRPVFGLFGGLKNIVHGIGKVVTGLGSAVTSLVVGDLQGVQSGLANIGAGVVQTAQGVLGTVGVDVCVGASWENCSNQTGVNLATICIGNANCENNKNVSLLGDVCMAGANCKNNTNASLVNLNIGADTSGSTNIGAINVNVGGNSSNSVNIGAGNITIAGDNRYSTTVGIFTTCVVLSDCRDNTNAGVFVDCGLGSNCSGSKNTGVAVTCGLGSNCEDSLNNALVFACGLGSNCSGSTNNGAFIVCGAGAVCTDSSNNGFIDLCIAIADCSNSTSTSVIHACGGITDCSTTSTIEVVKYIDC